MKEQERSELIASHGIETVEAWDAGRTVRVGGRNADGFAFYDWANPDEPLEAQFPGSNLGTWEEYSAAE